MYDNLLYVLSDKQKTGTLLSSDASSITSFETNEVVKVTCNVFTTS